MSEDTDVQDLPQEPEQEEEETPQEEAAGTEAENAIAETKEIPVHRRSSRRWPSNRG